MKILSTWIAILTMLAAWASGQELALEGGDVSPDGLSKATITAPPAGSSTSTAAPTETQQPTATLPALASSCQDLPKITGFPRFARLMHDPQWMDYPSRIADPEWPSTFHFDWYPETVPLWTNPKGGDGRYPYNVEWLRYLRAIQATDAAAEWIARVAAGLFNKGNDFIPILDLSQLEEEPVAESISSGGNVVRVLETRSGSYRIEMIYFRDAPPNPNSLNYQTHPWLVTKFTAVSVDGQLGHPGGIDVYFPNLSKQPEGYWVERQRVELFPELPYCAKVQTSLTVYASPSTDAEKLGSLSPGQQTTVHEYLPQGSDVWGRTSQGWIRLVRQLSNGWPAYDTSWQMETRPPILFPE